MKTFEEYLTQALKGYAAELNPEIARYQGLVGAYATVEKAEIHLREAIQREQQAAKLMEEAFKQARKVVSDAESLTMKLVAQEEADNQAAHNLRAETQALKDQATKELAEKERTLQARKVEMDQRSSDLDRRETAARELEAELNERRRKLNAAMA